MHSLTITYVTRASIRNSVTNFSCMIVKNLWIVKIYRYLIKVAHLDESVMRFSLTYTCRPVMQHSLVESLSWRLTNEIATKGCQSTRGAAKPRLTILITHVKKFTTPVQLCQVFSIVLNPTSVSLV